MGDISDHFSRSEFACKCGCGQDTVDVELITVLETVREYFDKPVTVNSGNRCPAYNKKVGGAKNSQHLLGRAADITVEGIEPLAVYTWLHQWHRGGLGRYPSFTHVDTRKEGARWSGS